MDVWVFKYEEEEKVVALDAWCGQYPNKKKYIDYIYSSSREYIQTQYK